MITQSILTNSKYTTPQRITENGIRYYESSAGKFPSITTVLGCRNRGWLEQWKANVGPDKSAAISRKASTIGSGLHLLCEHFLSNNTKELSRCLMKAMPETKVRFNNFKPFLDKITELFLSEAPLASAILKICGRVDAFVLFDGRPTVVDFKTANRPKSAEDIKGYFAQASFYAYSIAEQYNVPVPDILIAIAVDGLKEPQLFRSTAREHIDYLLESKRMYDLGLSD